jgi:hypothetical protein
MGYLERPPLTVVRARGPAQTSPRLRANGRGQSRFMSRGTADWCWVDRWDCGAASGHRRAFEEAWGTYPAVLVTPGANGLPGTGVALFWARGERIEPSTFNSLAHVGFRATKEQYEQAKAELGLRS